MGSIHFGVIPANDCLIVALMCRFAFQTTSKRNTQAFKLNLERRVYF